MTTAAASLAATGARTPARTGALLAIGFGAVIAILLLAGAGGLVRMIYPAGAVAVGLYLLGRTHRATSASSSGCGRSAPSSAGWLISRRAGRTRASCC